MLTEIIEIGCKIKEVKAVESEIKENIKGTNNEGEKKTGLKSKIWTRQKK